jgi:hypothetical protein
VVSLVVVLAVAVALIVIRPWAGGSRTSNTDAYNQSATFVSHNLAICIDAKVSGTITYKAAHSATVKGEQVSLTSIQLVDPVMTAAVHVWNQGAGCTTAKATVGEMSLSQHWSSPNGDEQLASYRTSYGSGQTFTQNNTGSPSSFANLTSLAGATPLCYRATIAVQYEGHASGSSVDDGGSATTRICLTPTY